MEAGGAPTRGIPALEPRAPVDLAWARHRWPVLVALTGGLKGLYLDEQFASNGPRVPADAPVRDMVGRMQPAELVLDWTQTSDVRRRVASRLAGYTGPLGTWDEFNSFCDATVTSGDLASNAYPVVPAMRSLLKANFNPNSRLNKFNPNRSMWNMVDKQDLLVYSTEFMLEPAHPSEVESVGRVLGKDGRLLASRALRCEISGPKIARLSTQREFVCANLGSLDRCGDETGVRIPGQAAAAPFLPASQGPGTTTWGQDLPWSPIADRGKGVGVQPYPEPYVDLDPASATWNLTLSPADYDGSLQQATVETPKDHVYGVSAPLNDMKMLSRWTTDLDLAVADADPARSVSTPDAKWKNQPDVRQAPLANSLLDSVRPNTLHPDGCYSERDRAPGYFDKNNANGIQGLLSFWFKPNYQYLQDLDEDASLTPGVTEGTPVCQMDQFLHWPGGGVASGTSPDQFFGAWDTCVREFPASSRSPLTADRSRSTAQNPERDEASSLAPLILS